MSTRNIIDDISLFKKCGIQYHSMHKDLKTFIEIEKELNDRLFTENIFTDKNINAFKLLSMQHIIYNELSKNNLEKNNVTTYLDFVK
jgi:DNA-binding MltR family transcriptional regulator